MSAPCPFLLPPHLSNVSYILTETLARETPEDMALLIAWAVTRLDHRVEAMPAGYRFARNPLNLAMNDLLAAHDRLAAPSFAQTGA